MNNFIEELKKSNIKFKNIDETKANEIIKKEFSFYHLLDYSIIFDKYKNPNMGFVNLDFSMLYHLAKIDAEFSLILMQMCMHIENHIKVLILEEFDENDLKKATINFYKDNQYDLDRIYCYHDNGSLNNPFNNCFNENTLKPYQIIDALQFGSLIRFYDFTNTFFQKSFNKQFFLEIKMLESVRRIRNIVAHGSPLLNKISLPTSTINHELRVFLRNNGVNQKMFKTNMSIQIICDLCDTFDIYFRKYKISNSEKTLYEIESFLNGIERTYGNEFKSQTKLISLFNFLKKVINIYKIVD